MPIMPIAFGDFTLDESSRQLKKGGEAIRLSPKGFQLLSILVHASPSAISKADLQDRLWPGTFVTEGSLTTLVTELRSALGDDARDPRYIRTLYGFGYSFAASVSTQPVASTPQPPKQRRRFGHLTSAAAFGAAGVLLILASRSTVETSASTSLPPGIHSIAILPFDTSGADRDDQHLGLGLPDQVITRMTNARQIIVRPTSTIRPFAGKHVDSEEAGTKLKVDAVLEGSIRTSPDRVRVTVQLLNIHDNKTIWAQQFDEKRADIFTIEDNMSGKLAEALRLQLTPAEKTQLGKQDTSNAEAYRDYVEGRYHLELEKGTGIDYSDEPLRAIEFFQKAVDKDPQFAAAWADLSRAFVGAGVFRLQPPRAAWEHARTCARKTLALDPTNALAYTVLGEVAANLDLNYDSALQLCSRSVQLNPRNVYGVLKYAYLLQAVGRFDEAIALRKLMVQIDPVSIAPHWGLAMAYITSGQYDPAEKEVRICLQMNPNFALAHEGLVRIALARGDYPAAIAEARNHAAVPENTRALAILGYTLGRAGRRDEARAVLEQITERSIKEKKPYYWLRAVVYAGLGDTNSVIPLLDKALDDREYAARLKTEPIFVPFHTDPRYIALLHSAGFKD